MLVGAPGQNPFEYFTSHVQLIGWGAVLGGVYKATRFLTKLTTKINEAEKKLDEMHKAVTHDAINKLSRLVALAETQNRRWEAWMMSKATHGTGHIGMEEISIHDAESESESDSTEA
jgi:hypothetical protein